jgi:hypothetical protein
VPIAQTPPGGALTYGDGSFVTVSLPANFFASTDGLTWSPGAFEEVYTGNISHGFNCFIVVGAGGLVLQSSPSVVPPRLQSSHSTNGLNLVLISEPGRAVDLQASSDLRSWGLWTNVTPTEGATTFSVSTAPSQQEFFRALAH